MNVNNLAYSDPIVKKYEERCGKRNIPGGRNTPYFRVDHALDESFLAKAREALASIPGKMRENGVMKDYLWHKMAKITFDDSHHITDTTPEWSHPVIYYGPEGEFTPSDETIETLSTLRKNLLHNFASELSLTGTHRIWMNCFGYRLKDGETKAPLPWHDDENNSWTGVTLLTDPNGKYGWTGGNLQLAPTLPDSDQPNKDKLVEIQGQFNNTIFFHNYGTKHTVTAITGKLNGEPESEEACSERIIFCIEDHCESNCRGSSQPKKDKCIIC